jgi:hypothetical protein
MLPATNEERGMRNNPRVRFLPVVMFPSILPAVLMPAMRQYVPANLLAAAMGVSIGLAMVGLAWMINGKRRCSTDS